MLGRGCGVVQVVEGLLKEAGMPVGIITIVIFNVLVKMVMGMSSPTPGTLLVALHVVSD